MVDFAQFCVIGEGDVESWRKDFGFLHLDCIDEMACEEAFAGA